MAANVSHSPTLPLSNPTTSYWQLPPDPEFSSYRQAATVPETADTVIIGSGITGACIAHNLLYPELSSSGEKQDAGKIVLLEAREACSGATGRNGGHTKTATYMHFPQYVEQYRLEAAVKIARFEYASMQALHSFARTHDIACDLVSCDTANVIYDIDEWEKGKSALTQMVEAMGVDDPAAQYTLLSVDETKERFNVYGEECVGAVVYKMGSMHPYKFVIAVLKLCLKRGLELYTHTAAEKLYKDEEGYWKVQTRRGTIRAKRVVLATNAYTDYLRPEFKNLITPFRGQATAHRRPQGFPPDGLGATISFVYNTGYDYMIERPKDSKFEGDLVIGGSRYRLKDGGASDFATTDDTVLNHELSKFLHQSTERYFGPSWGADHEDGRVRSEWTGIMGLTFDGQPFVGKVPDEEGLFVAAGFRGLGMVLCFLSARALVAMMEGREEDVRAWFPEDFKVSKERMEKKDSGTPSLDTQL